MQPKMGDTFHLKLNISKRPIAYKYREGKMKRTLKRELKVREIVNRETIGARRTVWFFYYASVDTLLATVWKRHWARCQTP
jgi:hypothetical protein